MPIHDCMCRDRIVVSLGWTFSLLLVASYGAFATHYLAGVEGDFDAAGYVVGRDFVVFWSTAVATFEGRTLELFGEESFGALLEDLFGRPQDEDGYAWVHPPPALFVVLPLASLPYLWALAVWVAVTFALYLLAARRVSLLCAPSTFCNAFMGQMGFLIGALYFVALRLLRHRPALAGVCFGLLAFKPHLGIMVPVALLAARAYRTVFAAAVTVPAIVCLSGLVFGWDVWQAWLTETLPRQASYLQGWLGIVWSGVSAFGGAQMAGAPPHLAWFAQVPCTAFAACATWWAFTRLRQGTLSMPTAGAILLLATCLATPYIFVYDLTLASPVALYGFARWRRRPWVRTEMGWKDLGEPVIWVLVWMLPFLAFFLAGRGLPVGSPILVAALALCVWYGREEVAAEAALGGVSGAVSSGRTG